MTKSTTKITTTAIEKLKPSSTDVWLWDTMVPGFGVRCRPSGRKTYVARYRNAAGVQRKAHIARCCDMPPEMARDRARDIFVAVAAGADPVADRHGGATENTVGMLFQGYVAHMRSIGRSSADEVERVLLLAKNNVADALGRDRPAANVRPDEIVADLARVFRAGTRGAADKRRSYISSAYSWAMKAAKDYTVTHRRDWGITLNPAADIARDQYATKARDRNLSVEELRTLWRATAPGCEGFSPETAACIRTLIACGQRVQETLRMEGKEIDLMTRWWEMPAHKTKGRQFPHRVPLPAQILPDLLFLRQLHGPGPLFACRSGEIMDHRVINRALARWSKKVGIERFQSRDLRRTWKSRAHDAGVGRFERDLIQQHAKNDTGSKHYDRANYDPEKAAAMKLWEAWITTYLDGDGPAQPLVKAS